MPALQPHAQMLGRYLYVLGARADRVDDLVQEVFVFALQRGVEDRGTAAVGAFLRGVAKNLLLRERRTAAARREVELADEVWSEQGPEDDRLDALQQCVRQLPARSRDMLERCYVQGAGRIELGEAFGMVPDGVKTTLRRVRAALRACVERRLRGAG